MTEKYRLLRNVRCVDPEKSRIDACDFFYRVRNGKSELLARGKNLRVTAADGLNVINMHGALSAPPFFDLRCSIPDTGVGLRESRQNALIYRESMQTGLSAAVTGGYAGLLLMPTASPMPDTPAALENQRKAAARAGVCRVFSAVPLTRSGKGDTLCRFEELKDAGARAICADFEEEECTAEVTASALRRAAKLGMLFISSSKKQSLHKKGGVNAGKMEGFFSCPGIEPLGELLALSEAIALSRFTGCPLHFPLVTLESSVGLLRGAKKEGVQITCGTSPHYFSFSEDELLFSGTRAKSDPPLRKEKDRLAIIEGLKDGTIDCICTDHRPLSRAEKGGAFASAFPGVVGLETAFAAGITYLVMPGYLTVPELFALMSVKPAKILGTYRPLDQGEPFDLLFFDPDEEMFYSESVLRSRSSNTPHLGRALRGRVKEVYIDGEKCL